MNVVKEDLHRVGATEEDANGGGGGRSSAKRSSTKEKICSSQFKWYNGAY